MVVQHPPHTHVVAQHHFPQHRPRHQGQQGAPVQVQVLALLQAAAQQKIGHRCGGGCNQRLAEKIFLGGQGEDAEDHLPTQGDDELHAVPRHRAEHGLLHPHLKAGRGHGDHHQHGPAEDEQVFQAAVRQKVVDHRHAHHPQGADGSHGHRPPAAALLAPQEDQGGRYQRQVKAEGIEHRHAERHGHLRSPLLNNCSAPPARRRAWGG